MEKLKAIISEYAGIEADKISEDMRLVRDIGLDSFALISMVMDIEKTFDVNISDEDLSKFQTLKDVVGYLKERSSKFDK